MGRDVMKGTMLKDSGGDTSSKRVMGTIGMACFLASAIGIAIYSVFTGNDIGSNAVGLITSVGIVSGGLLGVGVLEGLKK